MAFVILKLLVNMIWYWCFGYRVGDTQGFGRLLFLHRLLGSKLVTLFGDCHRRKFVQSRPVPPPLSKQASDSTKE